MSTVQEPDNNHTRQNPRHTSRTVPIPDLRPWFASIIDLHGVLNWHEFWGNEQPVELDIGCGRGLFLLNSSLSHPDVNYLGLELDYTEGRRAAKRLLKRNIANARIIGGDALLVLKLHLPPESVQAVHVYFPDPWWKPRHRRRRIFTDTFVDLCHRVLKPHGFLHSWTDVADYFDIIKALMNNHKAFCPLPEPQEHTPDHEQDYHTGFERKRRTAGCTIYRGLWQKRDSQIIAPVAPGSSLDMTH